ncbi:MAG: hypothetical protein MSH49_09480 [[Eubacterium] saphenum]|nr:hypothetical protein [[Eubacterium] saphenum]
MNCVDLSGKWDAFLDESKSEKVPEKFTDEIFLPNTTSNARLGKRNPEKNYGCLTDLYKFEGFAWFRRKIIVTREQARQKLLLFLERTRKTAVFIDGVKIGEFCSLVSPHRCSLDGISEGEHELLIRVDNTDYPTKGGHLTSPDTQTNWNGITGRIELICCSALPENIRILSDIARKTVTVKADIFGEKSGVAQLKIFDDNTVYGEQTVEFKGVTWDYDESGAPYLTELGISAKNNKQGTVMPDGASFEDGEFKMNLTTWSLDSKNPKNGIVYNHKFWESYNKQLKITDIEQQWRDWSGYLTADEYLAANGMKSVHIRSTYSALEKSQELQSTWSQVQKCIRDNSWKAIYAKTDAEYDQIVDNMISEAKAYGYDQCVEYQKNEAVRRKAAEDEALKDMKS